jgi:hypothetical protein
MIFLIGLEAALCGRPRPLTFGNQPHSGVSYNGEQ